jgi:uncharacterized membrane protein
VSSSRLEAFSDGVIAILITILVLELAPPHGAELADLRPLIPKLLAYLLTFVFIGIYWNNHHHLMQLVERIDGRVLWANMHLLFWLSLTSFATAWIGEHPRATGPVAAYGIVLLGAAIAYYLLTRALLARHGADSRLAEAVGTDVKGKFSAVAYLGGVLLAWPLPELALAIFVAVAVAWLVPDRRIARVIERG